MVPLFLGSNMVLKLLHRYFLQEVRNKSVLYSLLLYLIGISYLIYQLTSGTTPEGQLWAALLWVSIFFGTLQLVSRSFYFEQDAYYLYVSTMLRPQQVIIAKLLFNALYILLLNFAALFLFLIFFDQSVEKPAFFALTLCLGSLGFSSVLTFTHAIASRTKGNAALGTVLSIPLLIPVLKMVAALTVYTLVGVEWSTIAPLLGSLSALVTATALLAYLLFPYLWQD